MEKKIKKMSVWKEQTEDVEKINKGEGGQNERTKQNHWEDECGVKE
jgi:hypothetical protein